MAWPFNKDGIRPTMVRKDWNCAKCGTVIRRDSFVIKNKSQEYFCAKCVPRNTYFDAVR